MGLEKVVAREFRNISNQRRMYQGESAVMGSPGTPTLTEINDRRRESVVQTLLNGFPDISHLDWEEAARKALAVAEILYPDVTESE